MPEHPTSSQAESMPENSSGRLLPWQIDALPNPPAPGWRLWIGLIGPGVVLAGTSIGSGEWLFGPAVTAQYGGTLLWLATVSIVLQVFCNLMMMRYTVYCGEPIIVGGLRTWPGPLAWISCYALLDLAAIWPYNASNAAVPLAAAILGRLPGATDLGMVKSLGYAIFVLSFVPLIFGGTVYRMLEKIMTLKLVLVLVYLSLIAVFMVSAPVAWEVVSGFFRFGTMPVRAETIVVGPHFSLLESDDANKFAVKGTVEKGAPLITEFRVVKGRVVTSYKLGSSVPAELQPRLEALVARVQSLALPNHFFIQTQDSGVLLTLSGRITGDRSWQAERLSIRDRLGTRDYERLEQVPEPYAKRFREWLANQGLEQVGLVSYFRQHNKLPPLDWAMVAAFCAIAGAGGLSNTLFSNYARDKGWGMGAHVGAIPSAVGGRTISLSHVGKIFPMDPVNLARWRGWMRHIFRDQVAIWMLCSFLGMALPCMMSLEFIRNATVEGNRVAAMAAEGMAERHPEYRQFFWTMTLLCGFLVLAPGQISVCDQIARRWTDIIWTASKWTKRLAGTKVKYVYYGILALYAVWGVFALSLFNPLQIAKIGAVLGNVALAVSTLQALHVNRSLMPQPLKPHWILQAGALGCALFFLGITVIVVLTL
jgi:hypothetical protein